MDYRQQKVQADQERATASASPQGLESVIGPHLIGGRHHIRQERQPLFAGRDGRGAEAHDERGAPLPHSGDRAAVVLVLVDKLQRRNGGAAGGAVPDDRGKAILRARD